MKRWVVLPAICLVSLAAAARAAAAPECQALVERPITDDIGNHWPAGKKLPVTIARDGPDGGAYCAHGGGCLPRRTGGLEAVRLLDCRVGASIGGGDHRLAPIRPRKPAGGS